ncbi:hypothetical protein H4219_001764 [Mycoemilia scoparia]|uniref:Carbonic anhydrase n=1 Tax=Mycoemilia scoparia TaxID=417184 RepID=A0A9W8A2Q7_9FUNG|nr:hypothetical protein H4219_001764 [Mycoemilia scoparia]
MYIGKSILVYTFMLTTYVAGDMFNQINAFRLDAEPVVKGKPFDYQKDPAVSRLLVGNNQWVDRTNAQDPSYFSKLAQGQDPKVLWIGCSDSREAVQSITGTGPGDVFVHRNIGNVFYENDLNMYSVLEYTIEHLKINHIVVVGHTHCGAVKAALARKSLGSIDNWLRKIQNVYSDYRTNLDAIKDQTTRETVVSVLNAKQTVENIARTPVLQKAWSQGKNITLHTWLFDIDSGRILDAKFSVAGAGDLDTTAKWEVGTVGGH